MTVAEGAELDSGDLSGAVLERANPIDVPTVALRAVSQRAADRRPPAGRPRSTACTELVVRSADGRPVPLQVDGDYIGEEAEARFVVEPGALRIVC